MTALEQGYWLKVTVLNKAQFIATYFQCDAEAGGGRRSDGSAILARQVETPDTTPEGVRID